MNPQIHAFIFNWRGQLEKTLKTETQLKKILQKVTVINSDDDNKFDHWVNIGESSYFSAQFLKALELFNEDIFFHVQGDVTYDDWSSIIDDSKIYYKKYNYGIYAPNVDYTSWSSNRVDISTIPKCNDKKLKLVTMTDCSCWFINKKIIDEYKLKYSLSFKKNKYGFGADLVNCAISIKNNMPVIRDYNYTVNHPKNTNYSSEDAVTMLEEYLKSIKDEKIKFIIEKIRNSELNAIKNINISVKNIPIYCINLKRANKRKELMLNEWTNKRGISINFFEGFDGQDADIDNLPEPYNYNILNQNTFEEIFFFKRKMSIGEICCSISHCNLLKKLIDEGVDEAIILEDDAMPLFDSSEEFFNSIEACKKENENLNILLLHKPLDSSEEGSKLEILESKKNYSILNKFITCTQAIYYSKEGMKKCYESASRLIAPIDLSWQLKIVGERSLNLINKPLVEHITLTTYINEGNSFRVFISDEKRKKISNLKKLKIHTFYSRIHERFKSSFESLRNIYPKIDIKYLSINTDIPIKTLDWRGESYLKLKKILEIFDDESNNDDYFIYSDINVKFFKPFHREIYKLIQDNDFVFLNNSFDNLSTRFFCCQKTDLTKVFLKKCLNSFYINDELTIEKNLKTFECLKYTLLPKEIFISKESDELKSDKIISPAGLNLINRPLVKHETLTNFINKNNCLTVLAFDEQKIKISSLKKMRIYSAYSESHGVFKPWFESIYNVYPEIDIKYSLLDQSCQSGEFRSHGWDDVTLNKLKKILEIFDDNSNNDDYFIFSDIDIQFFKPFHQEIENLLQNNDIVFQNDYASGPCTGFFACRKTNIMKQFFNRALEIFHTDDQVTVHNTLKEFPNIKFDLLPKEFFTYGVFNNGEWDYPENNIIDFKIPSDIIFHHANWTIGIDNKLKLLNFVKDNYNNQRFL
jgi:GR25 family glycosyltransferase involved in LPS biosynthesis